MKGRDAADLTKPEESTDLAVWVGSTVGVVFAVVLILAVAYFLALRRKQSSKTINQKDQEQETEEITQPASSTPSATSGSPSPPPPPGPEAAAGYVRPRALSTSVNPIVTPDISATSNTLGITGGWIISKSFHSSVVLSTKDWTTREGVLFIRRFLRGFGTGVAIYAGVRTFTAFMRNPFRKGVPVAEWHTGLGTDCLRFASFLGLYPSLYHLILSALRRYRHSQDGWNFGIAGSVAGLSMLLEDPSRQKTLTFFTTARALGAGVVTLVSRGLVRPIPHAETLAFCTCCAALTTCVAIFPKLLPAGYYHSVLKWSRDYSHPVLEKLFRVPGERFLTCQEAGLHGDTCTKHALLDLFRSLPSFAKLYLPIHLAPVLVFKRDVLKKRPGYVLTSLARNFTYSTLFLSAMVCLAKYVICLLRHASGKPPPLPTYVPAVAGFICGFSVLLERVSRRKELVLFVIPQMLHAAHVLWKGSRTGSRLRVPQGYAVVFAVAMGVVMHAYEKEPASLTMLMTGLLKVFVGKRQAEGVGGVEARRLRAGSEF
ncbi:hypothetical protein ACOMHN_035595 [Nucella lapillus]